MIVVGIGVLGFAENFRVNEEAGCRSVTLFQINKVRPPEIGVAVGSPADTGSVGPTYSNPAGRMSEKLTLYRGALPAGLPAVSVYGIGSPSSTEPGAFLSRVMLAGSGSAAAGDTAPAAVSPSPTSRATTKVQNFDGAVRIVPLMSPSRRIWRSAGVRGRLY
jgi:hypothetical protein